jgi:hypothetical protein
MTCLWFQFNGSLFPVQKKAVEANEHFSQVELWHISCA